MRVPKHIHPSLIDIIPQLGSIGTESQRQVNPGEVAVIPTRTIVKGRVAPSTSPFEEGTRREFWNVIHEGQRKGQSYRLAFWLCCKQLERDPFRSHGRHTEAYGATGALTFPSCSIRITFRRLTRHASCFHLLASRTIPQTPPPPARPPPPHPLLSHFIVDSATPSRPRFTPSFASSLDPSRTLWLAPPPYHASIQPPPPRPRILRPHTTPIVDTGSHLPCGPVRPFPVK